MLCAFVWLAIAHFVNSLLRVIKVASEPSFDPTTFISTAGWLPDEFARLRKVKA